MSILRESRPTAQATPPPGFLPGLKAGFFQGLRKGARGFLWICRIVVPISFAVALLDWTGWLYALDPVFQPVMGLINLPPQAALPILLAISTSVYAAIGMMVVIPFSSEQVLLLAVFITIAHMLVVEGLIQHKSGINLVKIDAIRLVTAGLTVFAVSQFFPGTEAPVVLPEALGIHATLLDALAGWALSTLRLLLKILIIIMIVMVALETVKALGWNERLAAFFRPFMALLGLSPNVTTMWVAGTFFGLTYGSAVIMEEAASGRFAEDELERLHIALGINHSIVEDPALFLALGVGVFWTVVPRFLAAAVAVQLYRLEGAARSRFGRRASSDSA
ncbi:MAG: iron transporter [Chloroflexi bacterium]|nr:iron transporter [Chloroflexota bacterium]